MNNGMRKPPVRLMRLQQEYIQLSNQCNILARQIDTVQVQLAGCDVTNTAQRHTLVTKLGQLQRKYNALYAKATDKERQMRNIACGGR